MRPGNRPSADTALIAAVCSAAAAILAFRTTSMGDFVPGGGPVAGNAALSIQALIDGDPDRAASVQPLLGPVSVLLRVPFAGLAQLLGGDEQVKYQAGAFACLLGPAALGTFLAGRMGRAGAGRLACLVLALLCVVNPMTVEALRIGHPEEPLAAAFVTAAVVVAAGSPRRAGALIGLAIATKQWAVVALPVVLLGARRRRLGLILVAAAVAAAFLVPVTLADREAADTVRRSVLDLHRANVLSVWWPVSGDAGPGTSARVLPLGLSRGDVAPLLALAAVALTVVAWRRRSRPAPESVLALLAVVLMLRTTADPSNLQYYAVAPMLAVCAWESVARPGLPLISLLYAATSWVVFGPLLDSSGDATISAVFLALTALFALLVGRSAFARPGRRAAA